MSANSNTAVAENIRATYAELPLKIFQTLRAPAVNLYWLPSDGETPVLMASSDLGLSAANLLELEQRGCRSLYVRWSEFNQASSALLDSLETIVADTTIRGEQRFATLQTVVGLEVNKSFQATNCGRFVNLAHQVGKQIADLVSREVIAPQLLFNLAQHDTTTFVHATNVAAYAAMLAGALGMTDDERQQISVGGMLHDLGKRSLPKAVLNKPGKLDAEERELIESHPQRGYEELCDRDDVNHGQLMMVYQHHEWVNGRGYPVGIAADEIHPWAKLLAVVDVFDALTARRPYKAGMPLHEALVLLKDGINTQFDPEAVRCWISLFRQPSPK